MSEQMEVPGAEGARSRYEYWKRGIEADTEYYAVRIGPSNIPEAISVPLVGEDVDRQPPVRHDVYTDAQLAAMRTDQFGLREILDDMRRWSAEWTRLDGWSSRK